ncbi:hypothetical protein LIPSTDRAFT_68749, partial [Lipomyces starkeyi NRRL Y-11557]
MIPPSGCFELFTYSPTKSVVVVDPKGKIRSTSPGVLFAYSQGFKNPDPDEHSPRFYSIKLTCIL